MPQLDQRLKTRDCFLRLDATTVGDFDAGLKVHARSR